MWTQSDKIRVNCMLLMFAFIAIANKWEVVVLIWFRSKCFSQIFKHRFKGAIQKSKATILINKNLQIFSIFCAELRDFRFKFRKQFNYSSTWIQLIFGPPPVSKKLKFHDTKSFISQQAAARQDHEITNAAIKPKSRWNCATNWLPVVCFQCSLITADWLSRHWLR